MPLIAKGKKHTERRNPIKSQQTEHGTVIWMFAEMKVNPSVLCVCAMDFWTDLPSNQNFNSSFHPLTCQNKTFISYIKLIVWYNHRINIENDEYIKWIGRFFFHWIWIENEIKSCSDFSFSCRMNVLQRKSIMN